MRTTVDEMLGEYWNLTERKVWEGDDNSLGRRFYESYSSPDVTRLGKFSGMGCLVERMGAFRNSYRE
jgi:hypothetical protein